MEPLYWKRAGGRIRIDSIPAIRAGRLEPDANRGSTTARGRQRDLAEIAIAFGLILSVLWTPRPWQHLLWLVAAAAIGVMIALSFQGFRAAGLRVANFFRSFWIVGAALLFSAVTVAISARLHALRGPEKPLPLIEDFWVYAIWSGVQQFLLQCFFLSRLLRLLPSPRSAAFAAAGLFALAHLPNPVLAVLTVVWGSIACLVFLRYRNLYPLAIAHAVLGITIAIAVPGYIDHNMRVGLGYLEYHRSHYQQPMAVRLHAGSTKPARSRNAVRGE